ncbi:MAG: L-threonylcarbamoyladenylate synthase [Deltaproteobacteria bacterium]|jgi:tRNA threonylcarbamoyl adenosine modification protein (Sua5/YciO/YrdC/YwlC family)|nr:L-threonylcarbamoyladenylate synthase [Deltaproteobacteria bacterium]
MSKATVFHLDKEHPNFKKIKRVNECLKDGGVVIYPTDTVYAMGCDIQQVKAIDRLYRIKELDKDHLMSLICGDLSQASNYVNFDNRAFSTIKRLIPGPFTLILEANRDVPKKYMGSRTTVGIRIPDARVVNHLVAKLGRPLVTTSVVDDEGNPMLDPEEIYEKYGHAVDYLLNQGTMYNEQSTVLQYEEDAWRLIRQGKGIVP